MCFNILPRGTNYFHYMIIKFANDGDIDSLNSVSKEMERCYLRSKNVIEPQITGKNEQVDIQIPILFDSWQRSLLTFIAAGKKIFPLYDVYLKYNSLNSYDGYFEDTMNPAFSKRTSIVDFYESSPDETQWTKKIRIVAFPDNQKRVVFRSKNFRLTKDEC